jgi:5-methylcytosine-specific restriction protein A
MVNDNWTIDEIRITVLAYIEMLKLELKGEKFKKSEFNRNIRNSGVDRTKGSIEYRMENISAVFDSIGLPIIKGYLPAKNIGKKVTNEIIQILNEVDIFTNLFSPTTNEIELDKYIEIIRKLNNDNIPIGIKKPDKKKQEVILFARDPKVKAYVLKRANGICELCKEKGPFQDKNGNWFLEVHHLISIVLGGEDTIMNTAAICPNCHRELHYGIEAENKMNYLKIYLDKIYKQN